MDHSKIQPADCKCRNQQLPSLVSSWSKRAMSRIQEAMENGQAVDVDAVKHEAQLVASLGRGGPMAHAEKNLGYGHLCEDCPFRKRTPLTSTLGVDRPKARR